MDKNKSIIYEMKFYEFHLNSSKGLLNIVIGNKYFIETKTKTPSYPSKFQHLTLLLVMTILF